jgi:glycosyltransferase involved in cell wall biosynthesis
MRIVEGSALLDAGGGSTVACVPLIGALEADDRIDRALVTIASIRDHTAEPVTIATAGTPDALAALVRAATDDLLSDLPAIEAPRSATDADLLRRLLAACAPADVALVAPGVRVHPEWLARLRDATLSDTVVASATAMLGGDATAAQAIAASSLRLRPRIERIGPHCALLRRPALDLIDPGSAGSDNSWHGALRTLGAALRGLGMIHVAADDVAVELPASALTAHREPLALDDLEAADARAVADDRGPLPRAIARAAMARSPLTVTLDARSLTSAVGGTQTYALGLALALAEDPRLRLRALVPHDLSDHAAGALGAAEVELITPEQAHETRSAVVHRPQQISSPADFEILRRVGERLVITHQDLIAYHNPSYHLDAETWTRHRELTRTALAAADRVVFFSEHARRDALAEDLIDAQRAHVVGIGADRPQPPSDRSAPPAGLSSEQPFVFCLGANYTHKNRPFAIRMLIELHALGWRGRLVLAGPHMEHGSSRATEQELLAAHPQIADFVLDLGAVQEQTKRWLFSHARALIYPSIYEGFGLLPLEAAGARLPCLYAPQASLAELDAGAATLTPWDATASAAAALPLLDEGPARTRHLDALARLAAPSWSDVVERLLEIYRQAATGPRSAGALLDPELHLTVAWKLRQTEREREHHEQVAQNYQDALHALEERVSLGLPLIDRGGLLSEAQQRGLMRVAARTHIGRIGLAPFGLLGRIGASSIRE